MADSHKSARAHSDHALVTYRQNHRNIASLQQTNAAFLSYLNTDINGYVRPLGY